MDKNSIKNKKKTNNKVVSSKKKNSTKKRVTANNKKTTVSKNNINKRTNKNINDKKSIIYKNKRKQKIKNQLIILLFFVIILISFNIKSKPKEKFIFKSITTEQIIEKRIVKIYKINQKKNIKKTIREVKQKENITEIPIFTFHRIVPDKVKHDKYEEDEWVASADIFEQQIKYLYDNGYKTISLDQFYCWYKGKCNFDKKTVVLTFDDGNYDDYYIVLPILKKYNFKATTFIVGSRTTDDDDGTYDPFTRKFITQRMIRRVKKTYPNWQFQSHTYDLHVVEENGKERVLNITEEKIKEDFIKNQKFGFKYIAYPFGVYNDAIINQVKENNYNLAFTFREHKRATKEDNPYEIPRIKINGFSTVDDIKEWLDD